MILLRRSTMLVKTKEKDAIDQLLDQINFHGMTVEELAGEKGLLKKLTSCFYVSNLVVKNLFLITRTHEPLKRRSFSSDSLFPDS